MSEIMKLFISLTRGFMKHCCVQQTSVARKFSIIFSSSGNLVRSLLQELSLPTTVPHSLGEVDLTPCLVDGHLDADQENKNLEPPTLD